MRTRTLCMACAAVLLPFTVYAAYTIPIQKKAAPADPEQASLVIKATSQSGLFSTSPKQGMEVYLCKPDVKEDIEQVRKIGKMLAGKKHEHQTLSADLVFMRGKAGEQSVKHCTTGKEGTCSMTGIPPGSYLLYAGYTSSYSAGYWLLPVSVTKGESVNITLDKNNATECIKK